MDTFEIARLTDFDFEAVCKDIFEIELGVPLEIFAPGRDQGVDLRHIADPNQRGATIIQCKHWERTKSASLISNMKNKELPKIKKLKPIRYILATSVDLSPQAKQRLLSTLSPYTETADDIYGLQQIEALLRANPQIVQRHMRLWLSSSATLQAMLAKNIVTRSVDLADEVKSTMLIYVPNQSFDRAIQLLAEQNVCIISGGPGIGKTTLAQILTVQYAQSGYDIYEVSDDADEINQVWDENASQLFYYDDFLGQTSLEDRFNKNEDSRLLKIIRKVNSSLNKALILTTRAYLLEQAKQIYERISNANFDPLTCIVELADYTRAIRAEILYNHVYFSALTTESRAKFADPRVYIPIINHRNFNPRLIEYSLKLIYSDELALADPPGSILANFNNPRRIWEHIVLHQLRPAAVDILIALYTFARGVRMASFEKAFDAYRSQNGHAKNHLEFVQSLRILENTMIRISANRNGSLIAYDSGSVRDYMKVFVADISEAVPTLLKSAVYFEQVETLIRPSFSQHMPTASQLRKVMTRVVDDHPEEVVAAVTQVFTEGPASGANETATVEEIVPRISMVLNVAERLDAGQLTELVANWLSEVDLFSALPDPSDIVVMLLSLWESSNQRLADMRLDMRDAAIEYFFEDTSDWDNIEHVESLLGDLGEIAQQSAMDSIEQIKFEFVESNLSRLTEPEFWRPSLSDLRAMVQYAVRFKDADEMFPGLAYAQQLIDARQAREPQRLSPPSADPSREESSSDRIFEMFSSLAVDDD